MAQEVEVLSVESTDKIDDKEFLTNDPEGNPYRASYFLVKDSLFIQTLKKGEFESAVDKYPYDLNTVIEGVSDNDLTLMTDSSKYRICLLRFRKHKGEAPRWRIPMLPYEHSKRVEGKKVTSIIAETDTWWPITGRVVPWFRNGRKLTDALRLSITTNGDKFCATRNKNMKIGVAIFRYTGKGGEGWTRISNISYITLLVQKNGENITIKMNG